MLITLKDVAEEVGVSVHSVSAVLNGKAKHYRISQETSRRVKETAKRLGYDPENHRSARQMAARRHGIKIPNNVIAVCATPSKRPFHEQPFEGRILEGIEEAADRYNLDVLLCRLRPERLPRLIAKKEVDGVIMLNGRPKFLNAIRNLDLPLVKTGSSYSDCHVVSAQHRKGATLATSHLIELNHRCIAFIGHAVDVSVEESILLDAARERLAGFKDAMAEMQLPAEHIDISLRESYPEVGGCAFEKLWEKSGGTITAVVCYNDTIAMGVIDSAQKLGLKVPEDLSVTGFDNISVRYGSELSISSVHYDRREMGVQAVEILIGACDGSIGNAKEPISKVLPTYFIQGETTAAFNSAAREPG